MLRFRRDPIQSQLNLDTAGPAAYADLCAPVSPASTITPTALQAELQSAAPPFLLDVREPIEFAFCHLPGAALVPLAEVARAAEAVPRDRTVGVLPPRRALGHRYRAAPAAVRLHQPAQSHRRHPRLGRNRGAYDAAVLKKFWLLGKK